MKKLIWLAVLALGVAMVVPSSRKAILDKVTPYMGSAGQISTRITLGRLADDLETASRAAWPGHIPAQDEFQDWLIRAKGSTLQDQWGGEIWYQLARSQFTVGSNGPDGVRGSEDDLIETRQLETSSRR